MNKRTIILLVCLGSTFLCMFLPFKTYPEAIPNYNLYTHNFDNAKRYLSGFDLILPLISLGVAGLCYILIGHVRSKAAGIISLVFASLNCIYMLVILFAINFQLFSSRKIGTGIGFYILSLLALTLFVVAVGNLLKPKKAGTKSKNAAELLDNL